MPHSGTSVILLDVDVDLVPKFHPSIILQQWTRVYAARVLQTQFRELQANW